MATTEKRISLKEGIQEGIWNEGISRRAFVAGTGALAATFTIVPGYLRPAQASAATTLSELPPPVQSFPPLEESPAKALGAGPEGLLEDQIDSWVAVSGEGLVTIFSGKCELGNGNSTAILQIAADQLQIPMSMITIVQPDTARTTDQGDTSGSMTVKTEWNEGVRQGAAAARVALYNLAAKHLGAPVSRLQASNGVISITGSPEKQVSYAELIGNKKFEAAITSADAPLPASGAVLVGTSPPRIDIPEKAIGEFEYVQNVRLPGMLYGHCVYPPSVDAKLVGVDTDYAPVIKGDVKVVVKDNFVGVVATTEEEAIAAAEKLKPKWTTKPLPDPTTFYDSVVEGPWGTEDNEAVERVLVDYLANAGEVAEAVALTPRKIEATYTWPFQVHGPIGACVAVADVTPEEVTVWSGTQGVYPLREAISEVLGRPKSEIRVIYVEASGCYGEDGEDNAGLAAAVMSEAVGAPVRLQYTRADEHGWENFGQSMVMQASGGLEETSNQVVSWNYRSWTTSRGGRPAPAGNTSTGGMMGLAATPNGISPPSSPPLGPDSSNAVSSYEIPRMQVISETVPTRFYTGPMRSPNRIQNTFANESFIDELAALAGEDPVEFRVAHLTNERLYPDADERLIAVIKLAAEMAKWETGPANSRSRSGRVLTGKGIAGMQYEGTGAFAAAVTELSVDTKTGKIKVLHVWGAQDCGITINPEGMRAQAEGCVIQGISRTLKESVKWTSKEITTRDWLSYPILRFTEMPLSFSFQIIDRLEELPVGAGEVLLTAMPASIANAVFDATGVRLREVPFTPATVRAALAAQKQSATTAA